MSAVFGGIEVSLQTTTVFAVRQIHQIGLDGPVFACAGQPEVAQTCGYHPSVATARHRTAGRLITRRRPVADSNRIPGKSHGSGERARYKYPTFVIGMLFFGIKVFHLFAVQRHAVQYAKISHEGCAHATRLKVTLRIVSACHARTP